MRHQNFHVIKKHPYVFLLLTLLILLQFCKTKIVLNFPNSSCYYKTIKILAIDFNQESKTSNNMKESFDKI